VPRRQGPLSLRRSLRQPRPESPLDQAPQATTNAQSKSRGNPKPALTADSAQSSTVGFWLRMGCTGLRDVRGSQIARRPCEERRPVEEHFSMSHRFRPLFWRHKLHP
jgi:hypothetical protein